MGGSEAVSANGCERGGVVVVLARRCRWLRREVCELDGKAGVSDNPNRELRHSEFIARQQNRTTWSHRFTPCDELVAGSVRLTCVARKRGWESGTSSIAQSGWQNICARPDRDARRIGNLPWLLGRCTDISRLWADAFWRRRRCAGNLYIRTRPSKAGAAAVRCKNSRCA